MTNRADQNWPNEEVIEICDEELVPYGDYYVTRSQRTRSMEIKAALGALKDIQ